MLCCTTFCGEKGLCGTHALVSSTQHQQGMVPTKPLGGFNSSTKLEDKPAEPAKYNQMAPPMTAYTAEYALAKASAAMEGSYQQVLSCDNLSSLSCCHTPGNQQL